MYFFNPEHDQCLANGNHNYDPPRSSLTFARDCASMLSILENEGITVWGWDNVIRNRLLRMGIPASELPSDEALQQIRELSHRRVAASCCGYVCHTLEGCPAVCDVGAVELHSSEEVSAMLEKYGDAVLKAPWSGSGKGLRWVRSAELTPSDIGWYSKVIAKQGSVMMERRVRVLCNFAMLFTVLNGEVRFEGYSLFETRGGAYTGNVLASDARIVTELSRMVDRDVVERVRESVHAFVNERFAGRYQGPLGVDALICQAAEGPCLVPCLEINVRNTMGLIARRWYDSHPCSDDLTLRMELVNARNVEELRLILSSAVQVLTPLGDDTRFALCVNKL